MKATTRPRQLPDLNSLFNSGWLQHQQGKLPEAQAIYEEVLSKQPKHSEALHLLGIIALDSSNPTLAIELIAKSIESHSDNAAAYAINQMKPLTATTLRSACAQTSLRSTTTKQICCNF